ncbi:MAG: NAD-dependent epimerase/dehydratase family protein [Thermoanaerobaculia bacterium]|nr:NAD-dependent epimerase/dehydratase family protein [Thermoanaerobaculia bacterium]
MRIFMTGATGYIGSATASALLNAGHEITALVRPSTGATMLEQAGVKVLRGELKDLSRYGEVIGAHEAVIHTAMDPGDPEKADAAALDFLLAHESAKIIYTSGVWVFGDTAELRVDETSELNPIEIVAWRPEHELRVLTEAAGGGAVVRPGCVYGGAQSLLADWFASAEQGDPLDLIDDGLNRWAMVYLDDLADLYLKIAEEDHEGVFHAVDDTRETMGRIARGIIESVESDSEIRHMPMEKAKDAFGPFADALALDQHVSSDQTRSLVGWEPSVSFLESIERQWEEWRQSRE